MTEPPTPTDAAAPTSEPAATSATDAFAPSPRERPGAHAGPVGFTVQRHIDAPAERVFDALTQADHLTQYYVQAVAGEPKVGAEWTWRFGTTTDATLQVTDVVRPRRLSFDWPAHGRSYRTAVTVDLSTSGSGTLVSIREHGWDETPDDLTSAFAHCEGWTQLLASAKVYLELDVVLLA